MISETPPFWWEKPGWQAWCLSPFSFVYGFVAGRRMRHARRFAAPVPVICIGNFTIGGAGKTPTALAIARAAKRMGLTPGFLSRGYGGLLDVTTEVDPHHHRADAVGDEPLLLAREALTVISRRRVEGAKLLAERGADLIVMDDGFQSARLVVDQALIVVDSRRGVGNGRVFPAGPVRAPLAVQMRLLSAVLKVGTGKAADPLVRRAARAGKPVLVAALQPVGGEDLKGRAVLAFAGIADPGKFQRTLEELGAEVAARRDFADHAHLEEDEIADLLDLAEKRNLILVTTAKDAVRLAGRPGRAGELLAKARVVEVEMVFDDPQAPAAVIEAAVKAARQRLLKG